MKEQGDKSMWEAMAFFAVGFILCVGGIYVYLKSDDTAFNKASTELGLHQAEIKAELSSFRAEVDEWTKGLSDLQALCSKGFDQAHDRDIGLSNKLGVLELEVENLKKKQAIIHERMVPNNTRVRLKVDGPIPVEIYQRPKGAKNAGSLLERSGIKKSK